MAAKLRLPDVTLLTVTSVNVDQTSAVLLHCAECVEFGAVKMLSSALPTITDPRVQYIRIPPIDFFGYSRVIIEALNEYVQTSHCLIVQSDGFILDPTRWRQQFVEYDYIGAPWPEYITIGGPGSRRQLRLDKNPVGNGGFSLRSKKLLEVTSRLQFDRLDFPQKSEDLLICHYLYDDMRAAGIRFAPPEIAALFSIESPEAVYGRSLDTAFGFHGKHWLGPIFDAKPALSKLGKTLGEDVPRAQDQSKWRHVGRNELCPCGSGKKYKRCHGYDNSKTVKHARPFVSVIIPSYNHAAYIGETLQSVLNQSFWNFEIVITDDGSRDGTPDIIRQFSDPRIHLEVFQKNRGASVAANSAIRRSRGKMICPLSSDDYFLPGKLEKQVAFLAENPAIAAVFGLPKFIDQRGNPAPGGAWHGDVFRVPLVENVQSRYDWLRLFFFGGNYLCHPTAMVRRSVYDAIGLFDPRYVSLPDLDMWVRLSMNHEIHVLPDEFTAMRIRDDFQNLSAPRRDTILRSQIEHFEILKLYRPLPREFITKIFARDIASNEALSESSTDFILAQLALSTGRPSHKLFALDTMFNLSSTASATFQQLHMMAGSIDVFGFDMMHELHEMRQRMTDLQNQANRLSQELAAAQNEIARLGDSDRR
jgi:glycosyltransferase involved in cell wall biosynthesis